MTSKKDKSSNQQVSEELQRFKDFASKIFQVSIKEVREFEQNRGRRQLKVYRVIIE
jgi:hypothetical protein